MGALALSVCNRSRRQSSRAGRVRQQRVGAMADGRNTIAFLELVARLYHHYGSPPPPPSTDPLELIIWENIAYLASDERRAEAFATLKQAIGLRPEQILAAEHSALAAICKAGILPDVSAEKLLLIAKIAYEEFGSDLRPVLKKPMLKAKKALKK